MEPYRSTDFLTTFSIINSYRFEDLSLSRPKEPFSSSSSIDHTKVPPSSKHLLVFSLPRGNRELAVVSLRWPMTMLEHACREAIYLP